MIVSLRLQLSLSLVCRFVLRQQPTGCENKKISRKRLGRVKLQLTAAARRRHWIVILFAVTDTPSVVVLYVESIIRRLWKHAFKRPWTTCSQFLAVIIWQLMYKYLETHPSQQKRTNEGGIAGANPLPSPPLEVGP